MDAITLLKDDHKRVEKLFKKFEKAGDRAFVEKRRTVEQIIEELTVHAAIEDRLFYPVTRETVPAVEDVALESLEEHHVMKILMDELLDMEPDHERFDPKVTVLIENVRHHVEDEEGEYFPEVRGELGRNALTALGEAMIAARDTSPTRPRPDAPDEGMAGEAAQRAAGLTDRVTDTVSGVAQGGVAAVKDLVDRIRGSDGKRRAPHGSSRARSVASTVRETAGDQIDQTVAAVKEAKAIGEERTSRAAEATKDTTKKAAARTADATRTAKTEAKRTATSATKGARRTKTTAKQAATTTARAASGSNR